MRAKGMLFKAKEEAGRQRKYIWNGRISFVILYR